MGLLEQADGLRRQRAEADTLAARILPSLFRKMFGDPGSESQGTPRLADSVDLTTKFSDGPFGSNLKSDHYVTSGVRVVRCKTSASESSSTKTRLTLPRSIS